MWMGRCRRLALCTTVAVLSGVPRPAVASADGAESETREQAQARPDFLFGQPGTSIAVRGQWFAARAGRDRFDPEADLYDFLTETLTLEQRDFSAPGIGIDVAFALGSRLDARAGVDFTRTLTRSEYREFSEYGEFDESGIPIEESGIPIEQDTTLSQLDLTGSIVLAILPRGRAIGQYSWIPSRVVPYVGAGVGLMRYQFEQLGDFVDFLDLSIFAARLESSAWTPSTHVFGGADVRLMRQLFLTGEARYVWADADVTKDFAGFDPIDLTGLRISAGVRFVF